MRAKEGRCEGRKPCGFYAGEQETVTTMKSLREAGMGFDAIARHLNASSPPVVAAAGSGGP